MKVEVTKSSSAERDFVSLLQYFGAIDDALASRFSEAYDDTIEMIADFPDLGMPWESKRKRYQNLRWRNVEDFENYIVVYSRNESRVRIVRLLDARRDLEPLF